MRSTIPALTATLLLGLAVPGAVPAQDRDHQKSIEARGYCAQQGRDGDAETLRKCCKNMVPTQARQADWDRYTEVCMKARVPAAKRGDAATGGEQGGDAG